MEHRQAERGDVAPIGRSARRGVCCPLRAPEPLLRIEDDLADADDRGGHLDAFVLTAELQRLLERELLVRDQRHQDIRRGRRMLVSFFSLVGFTSMSSDREFSPTIMPSKTSVPGPTNIVPRSCRLASA